MRSKAFLVDYGEGRYLLKIMKIPVLDDGVILEKKGISNDTKLDNNIYRAKSTVFDLAMCNPWDYFITVTIDPNKYSREDLEKYHRGYSQFLRDEGKRTGNKLDYVMVPEQHKKGGWHEHGLIRGISACELRPFTLKEKLPHYLLDKIKAGQPIYDWPRYRNKFGFCDLEPIRNRQAVGAYISKYITKTLRDNVTKLRAHTYYSTKGLIRPYCIKKGFASCDLVNPDYENAYTKGKWFSSMSEAEEFISEYDSNHSIPTEQLQAVSW